MKDIIEYIIYFLLGEGISPHIISNIGYTKDRNRYKDYRVVIYPSSFFDKEIYGKPESIPVLPLSNIDEIPLLFGDSRIERINDTLIIYADIIASTYFLISRYEEMVKRNIRDEHGRFPGVESLPYHANFIHRPIVDEYGKLLQKWLNESGIDIINQKGKGISKLYLTHDLDSPLLYRSWKGVIRSILHRRSIKDTINGYKGEYKTDPYYTFPWLFNQTQQIKEKANSFSCDSIVFIRSGGNMIQDKPHYKLFDKDIQFLIKEYLSQDVQIGLHSSYQAGVNPSIIKQEKQQFEKELSLQIDCNRHHFLASREPEDMEYLVAAGIKDDFTMGYADVSGFRLGTSRPVRWINPSTQSLSSLILHPLTIMDCTLDEKKYMGLNEREAYDYCMKLIKNTAAINGEVVLLWHNTSVSEKSDSYLKSLYCNLLNEITQL